jgi:transposase-like protein
LERRRRIDRALVAVVMEAYVHGVSTRKVDDLVVALGGAAGVSKSEVSRIFAGWTRRWPPSAAGPWAMSSFPYVYLDATYLKGLGRSPGGGPSGGGGHGVAMTGEREVLVLAVGDTERQAEDAVVNAIGATPADVVGGPAHARRDRRRWFTGPGEGYNQTTDEGRRALLRQM